MTVAQIAHFLIEAQYNEEKPTESCEGDGKGYLQYGGGGGGKEVAIHSQESRTPAHEVEGERDCYHHQVTPVRFVSAVCERVCVCMCEYVCVHILYT